MPNGHNNLIGVKSLSFVSASSSPLGGFSFFGAGAGGEGDVFKLN